MAIVPNLARPGIVDVSYCVPSRANAGPPASSNFAGEVVYDSTAKNCIVNVGSPTTPYWASWAYGYDIGQIT